VFDIGTIEKSEGPRRCAHPAAVVAAGAPRPSWFF
jgi:hypothetical protein